MNTRTRLDTRILLFGLGTFCCLAVVLPASAVPSAALQATLATRMPAVSLSGRPLQSGVLEVIRQLRNAGRKAPVCTGIEFDSAAPSPKIAADVPAGTLQEQLDKIAETTAYTWQANGDFLHFVPKAKAEDPNYALNLRIPGTLVISRDGNRYTSIKEWLNAHRIGSARSIRRMTFKKRDPSTGTSKAAEPTRAYGPALIPDPFSLENATLREHFAAHEAMFGNDFFMVQVTMAPARDGTDPPWTSLLTWGENTKAFAAR